ncbi:TPA: hypothetical protein O4746_001074 [Staphylococcus aureus]|uniref:Uncharacterized protein n=1 Tax=Staphylococcus aureus TaxID=1280 RepID=A0AAW4Y672_STAAU|nr:hypothetical protein [Staphylococcus aureus]MBE7572991.1 hypothetical protein [Staphylococcus aureus]MBE7583838.1 hypothetical protein [Staphylococcus aureus]MBE7588477.1 hypothetical protein [Staphylococcus aureus]MBE7590795.1 hypothetical protein [Staphylococcus aureus]MBE7602785.1 hypothetical protein [Staphylococcus aureus]
MNNDRGQSLQIPSSTPLKENYIYVATLHSVRETNFSGDVKHQFTYEIEVNNQISSYLRKHELKTTDDNKFTNNFI